MQLEKQIPVRKRSILCAVSVSSFFLPAYPFSEADFGFLCSQDKVASDKAKLSAEFDEMRKATNDSITEAATATKVKDEAEAKLRNLMDGATVAEKELEVALFNSVHECAQVRTLT